MPFDAYSLLWALPVFWLIVVTAIVLFFLRDIRRLWREPVLTYPVLIIESDDWGAGPLVQASALTDIAGVLRQVWDSVGRTPVLSLALILAVPDGRAIRADRGAYHRICLDDPSLAPILRALMAGESEGIFSLQLHGLEHFWPGTLMSSTDPAVQCWIREPSLGFTEQLPPHLQSRWIDTAYLPSRPLPDGAVLQAVNEEIETYTRVVGHAPTVVVPPTFVWTAVVERAWAANGIECVSTPGEQYTARGVDGAIVDGTARIANGDRSGELTYLVRCDYFEPARGRGAEHALRALVRATSEGRPCILENHRDNFCRDAAVRVRSLRELEELVVGALARFPTLKFVSSSELCRIFKRRDRQWILTGFVERSPFFWQRLRHTGRPWKWLKFSGAALPGELLMLLAPRSSARSHA